MKAMFSFLQEKIPIQSVFLHIHISHTNFEAVPMTMEDSIWRCELDLPTGEHLYRFIINEELPLCDPYNNLFDMDSGGNLWSLIIIDEDGKIRFNPEQYHVTISQYRLSANAPASHNLGAYQVFADEKISANITCTNITGTHLMTAAWYTPIDMLYEYSESPVCANQIDESVFTTFWIERTKAQREYNGGLWTLRLFLDGKLVLSDKFSLTASNAFNNYG